MWPGRPHVGRPPAGFGRPAQTGHYNSLGSLQAQLQQLKQRNMSPTRARSIIATKATQAKSGAMFPRDALSSLECQLQALHASRPDRDKLEDLIEHIEECRSPSVECEVELPSFECGVEVKAPSSEVEVKAC